MPCSCIQHLAYLAEEEGQHQHSPRRSRGSPRRRQQQPDDSVDPEALLDLEAGHGAPEGCSHCLHHHSAEQQESQQGAVAGEASLDEGPVEGDVERAALLGGQRSIRSN